MTLGISDDDFESAIDEAARPKRIDLAHAPDFAVGPVRVAPSLRTISGPAADEVLEPKVMQVLIALGEEPGRILSRDDLIERCWEGRVVGESSINRVISLLRAALKSVCEETVRVENVPKVGYRLLLDPVWEPPQPDPEPETIAAAGFQSASPRRPWGKLILAIGVAALLAIVAGAYASWSAATHAPVRPITIAMLPLKAGEGVDPLYARGLEAELRSQLARTGSMEVTSSDSARQLVEQGLSADEICTKLGADFAWIGALDVEAERVTLRTNLIDASTKQSAYREALSSAPDDAQNLPLRNARAITTALGRPVTSRAGRLNISAGDYRLYLTALGLIKGRGFEQLAAAYDIMQRITENNPRFADGWAGFAKATFLRPQARTDQRMASLEEARRLAHHALSLDPDTVDALKVAGQLEEDPQRALEYLRRATELDPGDSEAWFWRSVVQDKFRLEAGDPLVSVRRMVDIDPLWPATWRASDLAVMYGQLDLAREIEKDILAAAVTPSQKLLVEARLARIEGDLSTFAELSGQAARTQSEAERRYGSALQLRMMRVILDLPPDPMDIIPRESPMPLVQQVYNKVLPSRAEMAAAGVTPQRFWQSPTFAMPAMRLYLEAGREADLLALYDAAFGSTADYLAMAAQTASENEVIPSVSPYIVKALRAQGRTREAEEHIAAIERAMARWRAAKSGWVSTVIWEIQLAALKGDKAAAIAAVRRLPDYSWPYAMAHIETSSVGLLTGNPLYDGVDDLPEVRAVLDPIRAKLAKEREEVLALGV